MTSLIRCGSSPARELFGIRDDVDRLFDSLLQGRRGSLEREWTAAFAPSVDIEETRDEFMVRADLPGVSPKDVKVSLLGDTLTIRGERKQEEQRSGHDMHRTERRYGTFERSFSLGVPVRIDQVQASYRDGVLEIRVPKAEEAKLREIEVRVGS